MTSSGIPAYIGDEGLWEAGKLEGTAVIRVMVDNRLVDRARRVLNSWDKTAAVAHK